MIDENEFDECAAYRIRVKGQLEASWSDWLCGFEITPTDGETTLFGLAPDQSALYGVLAMLDEMGFTLMSVARFEIN